MPYIDDDIILWVPFTNPYDPFFLHKGTGSFSFTRATTATYRDPKTGLILPAVSGQLRIEKEGALIEGQRTNHALYSEQFDQNAPPWDYANATITANSAVSPDGNTTAEKFTEAATTSVHQISQQITGLTDNTTYCFSIFAKKGNGVNNWCVILILDKAAVSHFRYFNLDTGAMGTATGSNVTTGIEKYNNGWYRIWISANIGSGATTPQIQYYSASANGTVSYAGSTSNYQYIFGAQLEAGGSRSSYVPTTSATVTRNEDLLYMANFTTFGVNPSLGAAFAEFDYNESSHNVIRHIGASSTYFITTGNGANMFFYYGAITDVISAAENGVRTPNRMAISWSSATSMSLSMNGTAYTSATPATAFSAAVDSVLIGTAGGAEQLYGHVKNLKIWNRVLTQNEMNFLTAAVR